MSKPVGDNLNYYTYKDYLQWPEHERWEIIDGIPYNMTPTPSPNHQRVLGEFFSVFLLYLKGKPCEVFVAPFDVRIPRTSENDEDSSTVVQPDLTIICDPHKIYQRGCLGSPDMVLEITSPGTLARDMKYKLLRYEEARIKEYWIVHPEGKTVLVYQLSQDGLYKRSQVYANQDLVPVGIFPDLEINLQEIFSVIPAED
jgi:Uncharacterized protein conserved in cyanobacteria